MATSEKAEKAVNPGRVEYVERHGLKRYRARYNAGWKYSGTRGATHGLDPADHDGRSGDDAWMDGYMDYAVDRKKWHLLWCQDHGNLSGCNG